MMKLFPLASFPYITLKIEILWTKSLCNYPDELLIAIDGQSQSVNGITGCNPESYWTNFLFVAGFLSIGRFCYRSRNPIDVICPRFFL